MTPKKHKAQLGARIRAERVEAGLTQDQLGKGICSGAFISAVESGQTFPSVETLIAFGHRLRVPASALIGRTT